MDTPLPALRECYQELLRITATLESSSADTLDAEILLSLLADRQDLLTSGAELLQAARSWIKELPAGSPEKVAAQAEVRRCIDLGRQIESLNQTLESRVENRLNELRAHNSSLQRARRTLRTYRPTRDSEAYAVMDRCG